MIFGLGGAYFMHTSEGEGWKQRPDEEGIGYLTRSKVEEQQGLVGFHTRSRQDSSLYKY